MQSSTTISYLGSNSLSSSLGKTCAQLHEHFVAAHMKYACNFEFAIHLNVFLITFYASEPRPRPWQDILGEMPHHNTKTGPSKANI